MDMSTTTVLATPDPDDLDQELHALIREAGATLADPLTDPALRRDLKVTLGTVDVFASRNRATVDPGLRADLVRLFRNPPPVGDMWDAVFKAGMNCAYRNGRKVA